MRSNALTMLIATLAIGAFLKILKNARSKSNLYRKFDIFFLSFQGKGVKQ